MSQVAVAVTLNPPSVQQDVSVPISRTSTVPSENPRELSRVRSNESDETSPRPEPKLFKDVLEKRLPQNSRQETAPENSGNNKSEKKKSNSSIRDWSNISLLSMNPALLQPEKQVPFQITQKAASEFPVAVKSKQPIELIRKIDNPSHLQSQPITTNNKVVQLPHVSQAAQYPSVLNNGQNQEISKIKREAETSQGQTKHGIDSTQKVVETNQKSSQISESKVVNSGSELLSSGAQVAIDQNNKPKIDSQPFSLARPKEGSKAAQKEISLSQDIKESRKLDKTKNSSDVSISQNNDGLQQAAQSEGGLSFIRSQYDVKQTTVTSGVVDSRTNIVSNTDTGAVAQSPGRQVVQAIRDQLTEPIPQSQIQLTLNPPELGKIRISFQQNNEEITGLLEVDKLRTRTDIQKELPQVLASLQSAGVQIRRLDVVMNNSNHNPSPDSQSNQSASDSFMKQADSFFAPDSRQEHNRPGFERSSQDFPLTQTPDNADQEKSFIRDDAINVYL